MSIQSQAIVTKLLQLLEWYKHMRKWYIISSSHLDFQPDIFIHNVFIASYKEGSESTQPHC